MQAIRLLLLTLMLTSCLCRCENQNAKRAPFKPYTVVKTDDEWEEILSDKEYYILRKKGTERGFTGAYWNLNESGIYQCKGCAQLLFTSDTKFDSGTGWPSFFKPCHDSTIAVFADFRSGMAQEEVVCSRCGGHLGHVFADGPEPTGLRYCLNSASLTLIKIDSTNLPGF